METKRAILAFSALAQATRLSALRALVRSGPQGLSAGAIADEVAVAAPTLSFHLKELAFAGLVTSRREGRSIIYAADYDGIRALIGFLLADCCQRDPRIVGDFIVNQETCHEPPACALQSPQS